ncbi:hypothetical protein JAAARDRAFT_446880 [Jaapia argillacea MUCL 33604]|uniref:CHAT domain-containing protein n=1 Tax=Jaapia argillacea MUCL 33604 TaxID=933084 RepID=A0A067PDH0_9AGAM|nr:hypothetical protein JAAARDRAFT_446880 [Jaapia argillacea MUCL 33604]
MIHQDVDEVELLEESVNLRRRAVELTPLEDPDYHTQAAELAGSCMELYEGSSEFHHLDEAIHALHLATKAPTIDDFPTRSELLWQYALWKQMRYHHTLDLSDFETALSTYADARDMRPAHHTSQAYMLEIMGVAWLEYYRITKGHCSLEKAFELLQKGASSRCSPALSRVHASATWAKSAADLNHTSAIQAYGAVFDMVAEMVWLPHDLKDIRLLIWNTCARHRLAAISSACAIGRGDLSKAVEWLDAGRSLVVDLLLQLRMPLEELRVKFPSLAQDLERLSRDIDSGFAEISRPLAPKLAEYRAPQAEQEEFDNFVRWGRQRSRAEEQLHQDILDRNRLLVHIRSQPGFSRFLMHRRLEDMIPAARNGPVILLNVTSSSCDALILRSSAPSVIHINLPGLDFDRVKTLSKDFSGLLSSEGRGSRRDARHMAVRHTGAGGSDKTFRRILGELWRKITLPVLKFLGYKKICNPSSSENLPRVWWYPTGPLSQLPLHAAGIYDRSDNVSITDYVVSSYAPMISALLPSSAPSSPVIPHPSLLAIRATETEFQSLPGAIDEVRRMQKVCGSAITTLEGQDATVESVLSGLQICDLVHFACHGVQDINFQSALLLSDGRLEVSRLVHERLPNARFAFLSACETAMGDREFPDEVDHIAMTLLSAGFKGVVGTLWSIEDRDGPRIAEEFYSYMFRNSNGSVDISDAAFALHRAVRQIRESGASFVRWLPFIHIGI